jgi:Zn-dependent M28 family amino/carboxypeptidase
MIDKLSPTPFVIAVSLISLLFFGGVLAQEKGPRVSTEEELKADVAAGPCKNDERFDAVKKLFQRMGATDDEIKVETFDKGQNIVLSKKGTTDETVILGAHYDKVSSGCGLIDNWSGVVILAHMYRTLKSSGSNKSYIFAAFDKEEQGMQGSAAMAKAIPKEQRTKYCSMINLDSFGLGYPLILENASSPSMIKLAKDLGKELNVPVNGLDLPAANSDSTSFRNKDIPAITLSALSGKWPEYMHTDKDKLESVIPGSVRVGYNYGLQYLIKIDGGSCDMFRK